MMCLDPVVAQRLVVHADLDEGLAVRLPVGRLCPPDGVLLVGLEAGPLGEVVLGLLLPLGEAARLLLLDRRAIRHSSSALLLLRNKWGVSSGQRQGQRRGGRTLCRRRRLLRLLSEQPLELGCFTPNLWPGSSTSPALSWGYFTSVLKACSTQGREQSHSSGMNCTPCAPIGERVVRQSAAAIAPIPPPPLAAPAAAALSSDRRAFFPRLIGARRSGRCCCPCSACASVPTRSGRAGGYPRPPSAAARSGSRAAARSSARRQVGTPRDSCSDGVGGARWPP